MLKSALSRHSGVGNKWLLSALKAHLESAFGVQWEHIWSGEIGLHSLQFLELPNVLVFDSGCNFGLRWTESHDSELPLSQCCCNFCKLCCLDTYIVTAYMRL